MHITNKILKEAIDINVASAIAEDIKNLDKKGDDKLIRRGLLNLNYAYLIDTYTDQKELYKKFYLAAKKVNEFSSIHYKISG